MENRRNYYRILHVQPDAPPALVKSSYRTLMQHLKFHPDLGGDHWNASILNEAYAVISDPKKRAAYDEVFLDTLYSRDQNGFRQNNSQSKPAELSYPEHHYCAFCKMPFFPSNDVIEGTCLECESPLSPVACARGMNNVKRAVQRIDAEGPLQYFSFWPQSPHAGYYTNMSPLGLHIVTREKLYLEQILKVKTKGLHVVASVAHFHELKTPEHGFIFGAGLRFLTAEYELPNGTFLDLNV